MAIAGDEQRADGVGHGGARGEHRDAHHGGVDAPEATQFRGPGHLKSDVKEGVFAFETGVFA